MRAHHRNHDGTDHDDGGHLDDCRYEEALYDCDRALECQPTYVKALMRRSGALEKFGKLDEAKAGEEERVVVAVMMCV